LHFNDYRALAEGFDAGGVFAAVAVEHYQGGTGLEAQDSGDVVGGVAFQSVAAAGG
jgi:hypothetical protein